MKADKGDPVKMYGVEGACLGIATIASVEEINNPLPEGTKLSNFCIDDGDKQYTTKVRFLCAHYPIQRALFAPLNALRKALQIFCIFVSIAPESCASPALQDMHLPSPCDHQRCTLVLFLKTYWSHATCTHELHKLEAMTASLSWMANHLS